MNFRKNGFRKNDLVPFRGHSNKTWHFFGTSAPLHNIRCHLSFPLTPTPPLVWRDNMFNFLLLMKNPYKLARDIFAKKNLPHVIFGDTLDNPSSPLKCHVLFEWPLRHHCCLSSNQVFCLLKEEETLLWICTDNLAPSHLKRVLLKQWPLAPHSPDSLITRVNLARWLIFFSKMAFGECRRVWGVLAKVLGKCWRVWLKVLLVLRLMRSFSFFNSSKL
jgi:hypothetical protein